MSTGSFYGMALFEAETMEKILEVFSDREYLRVVVPDGEKFFNRSTSVMMAGHPAVILGS